MRQVFDRGEMWLGDCLDLMADIPDGSIDMILCDLPYGTTRNKWDALIPFEPLWAHYWRVAKPNAAIVLTAAQPFTSALVMSQIERFRYDWTWEKNNPSGHLNANRAPLRCHEDVLVFGIGQTPYFPQKTSGHPRKTVKSRDGSSSNYGSQKSSGYSSTDRYPRSVQLIPGELKRPGNHPTQKPVALFEYLIRTYTTEGQTVLDNCSGSGTTAVAAHQTDRRYVCIEQDVDYYLASCERVAALDG